MMLNMNSAIMYNTHIGHRLRISFKTIMADEVLTYIVYLLLLGLHIYNSSKTKLLHVEYNMTINDDSHGLDFVQAALL